MPSAASGSGEDPIERIGGPQANPSTGFLAKNSGRTEGAEELEGIVRARYDDGKRGTGDDAGGDGLPLVEIDGSLDLEGLSHGSLKLQFNLGSVCPDRKELDRQRRRLCEDPNSK
jgi:hypothetical protein